jgi:hypothetical protein
MGEGMGRVLRGVLLEDDNEEKMLEEGALAEEGGGGAAKMDAAGWGFFLGEGRRSMSSSESSSSCDGSSWEEGAAEEEEDEAEEARCRGREEAAADASEWAKGLIDRWLEIFGDGGGSCGFFLGDDRRRSGDGGATSFAAAVDEEKEGPGPIRWFSVSSAEGCFWSALADAFTGDALPSNPLLTNFLGSPSSSLSCPSWLPSSRPEPNAFLFPPVATASTATSSTGSLSGWASSSSMLSQALLIALRLRALRRTGAEVVRRVEEVEEEEGGKAKGFGPDDAMERVRTEEGAGGWNAETEGVAGRGGFEVDIVGVVAKDAGGWRRVWMEGRDERGMTRRDEAHDPNWLSREYLKVFSRRLS